MDLLLCTSATHTKRKEKKKVVKDFSVQLPALFVLISRSKTKISAPFICLCFWSSTTTRRASGQLILFKWKTIKKTLCYLENGSRSVNLVWQCQVWYLIRWPWLIVGILHAFSQLYYTLMDNSCCLKDFFFFKWRASLPGTEAVLDVHMSAVGKTKLPIALLPDHCQSLFYCSGMLVI